MKLPRWKDYIISSETAAQIEYAAGYKLNKKAYKVGHWFTNEFETSDPQLIKQAVATAAKAELVIYIGGLSHDHGSDCEGYDKPDLKLPYGTGPTSRSPFRSKPQHCRSTDGRWSCRARQMV